MIVNLFPLIKKFSVAKSRKMLIVLKEHTLIYNKAYKAGTVFSVIGWREVKDIQYLIISKGSCEMIVNFATFNSKVEIL